MNIINLRNAVYYEFIDNTVVEIFDKYKWGLKRLGIEFSQELLETFVYCSFNLEGSLIAFCAWVLWKKEIGEKLTKDILTFTLIDALKQGWSPSEFQENYLKKKSYIFDSPKVLIWKKAGNILGDELRNQIISDITEDGKLIFRYNFNLTPDDYDRINTLRAYIVELLMGEA